MWRGLLLYLHQRVLLNALAGGDYDRAGRALARIERLEGRSRRVVHNLALVRMGQGDHAGAEALLTEQVRDYGGAPALLRALAEAAYLSGDRARAAQRIADALADRDCPDRLLLQRRAAICADPEAHARAVAGKEDFAEGNRLLERHDSEGAIRAFRRAAAADPSDFVALNNLGTLLLNHAKDPAAAAEVFERALQLSDQPLVRANLAAARAGQGR
jgi:Flp pilus assembly protein TadD